MTYKGLEFDGKHTPLVSRGLFEQVQLVIEAHRTAGERSRRHRSYLAGSLFCGHCKAKLLYSVSRGRNGEYGYFFCSGRHNQSSGCQLPYLADELIEDAVIRHWRHEQLSEAVMAEVREGLQEDLREHQAVARRKVAQIQRRIASIERERAK
ncbi:recombinase zinc ribbon domain-containing protein [Nocardioides pyridinolyticus]